MDNWLCYFLAWMIFGVIGFVIGDSKGKALLGFAFGFFLGPLGIIIAMLIKAEPKPEDEEQMAARMEMEERALRDRIEREERIRAQVRAKIDAEKK